VNPAILIAQGKEVLYFLITPVHLSGKLIGGLQELRLVKFIEAVQEPKRQNL
jgi:hypothetical protein